MAPAALVPFLLLTGCGFGPSDANVEASVRVALMAHNRNTLIHSITSKGCVSDSEHLGYVCAVDLRAEVSPQNTGEPPSPLPLEVDYHLSSVDGVWRVD